ncbi:Crp/Fnr family transcriptional regulator [Flavobacterium amniphilum]|uniref:Crp/Fnr family transcriptional regulator n=1 Tax=Flavobacterium amniphilum TaxID=1834035 RepID=UPI002029FB90|nr:Crp/Fnr family transcriptional regulator [Flavobacterium amniphilum]MCL9806987.1 Crp/Fnr family transcriptional regulator [Flavobacterium amniphilum]
MDSPLYKYIKEYSSTPLYQEDFDEILTYFIPKKLKKRSYFLQEGEVCEYVGFIIKGAMREYYVDNKNREYIVNLYVENWWVRNRESWVMSTPSKYNIDTWEDSELILITKENFIKLKEKFPSFNEMVTTMDERNIIATQNRVTLSISLNAEDQYQNFIDKHEYFFKRFPQHVIASYLGISKDTLSRLRRRMKNKN